MKKKLFIPVCLTLMSLGLVACNDDTPSSTPEPSVPAHTHTWESEWKHDDNNHWHGCTDTTCTEVDSKAAHAWDEGTVTTQPTEEAVGEKTYECSVCGATKTEEVSKLEHTHKFAEVLSYDETYHWYASTCGHENEVSGKAEHTWDEGEVTTQPTEEAEGVKTFGCTACEATKTEPVAKLEHTHKPADVWTKDASGHWKECSGCEEKVDFAEHTAVVDAAKDATCTEAGLTEGSHCSVCEEVIVAQQEVPAAGHAWAYAAGEVTVVPSSTEAGAFVISCSGCEEKQTMVLPVYNEENYTTTFEVVSSKAKYAMALTTSAVEAIVTANEVLDDAKLTEALTGFKHYLAPSALGKEYSIVVGGKLVEAAFVEGKVSLELPQSGAVAIYKDEARIYTWTAPVAETYTFVKDAQDKVKVEAKLVKYFLVPTTAWKANNARFAAYHWNGIGSNGWTSMTWSSGDNAYVAEIDVTVWQNVIFCSMKGTTTDNTWNDKVYQTTDQTLNKGNKFTVGAVSGNNYGGSWSTIVPHVHTLVEGLVDDGTTHYQKCENCEDKVNPVAHKFDQQVALGHEAAAATCTTLATSYYSCACGANGTETFEVEGTMLDHDYDEENYLSNAEGHWFKCKDCDATTEVVAHTPNVEAATELTAKECTVCGYVIQAALNHEHVKADTYSKDATGHWYVCVAENACDDALEFAAHTWTNDTTVEGALKSAATCCAKAVYYQSCSVCGYVSTELTFEDGEFDANNHKGEVSYTVNTEDPTKHDVICLGCNAIKETTAHTGAHATFNAASTCACGEVFEAKLTKLYVKPNSNWQQSSARYAAYFFGSNGNTWVSMTDTDKDGIYECTIPSGSWTNVIFCRMNPGASANNWDNKWNQTGDLAISGSNNYFIVPAGAWDGSTSGWTHKCTSEYK